VSIDGPASQLSIAGGAIVAGGVFSISNGAHVTSSKATVQENGIGDVTMSGADSSWIISGNMDINGPLKLSVTDNAQLVAANWRILQNSLQAVGSITGNMEVGFFGALAPGAPIGELAIVGNYFDHISTTNRTRRPQCAK
jgi:hypothetical protein